MQMDIRPDIHRVHIPEVLLSVIMIMHNTRTLHIARHPAIDDIMSVCGFRDKGLGAGEDVAEGYVDDDASHEPKEPVKRIQVLSALADVHWVLLCRVSWLADGIAEAWEVGRDGDEEREERAPVDAVPELVAAVRVVEGWDVNVLSLDEPEIRSHDTANRCKEHCIAAHESEKGGGGVEDFPGHDDPSPDNCGDNTTTLDIDVARK